MDGHAERCASFTPVRKLPKAAHQRWFRLHKPALGVQEVLGSRSQSDTFTTWSCFPERAIGRRTGSGASGWHPGSSEQRFPKPLVGGSSPPGTANVFNHLTRQMGHD